TALFVGSSEYDWGPVVESLRRQGSRLYQLGISYFDRRWWTGYFPPRVRSLTTSDAIECGHGGPSVDPHEADALGRIYDRWLAERSCPPELVVAGTDLFPAASRHLRAMIVVMPALLRHADNVAVDALDRIRPDVVCHFAFADACAQRLSYVCQRRNIPVVCYQHALGYGVQVRAKDELIDPVHSD